jgi:putative transposase
MSIFNSDYDRNQYLQFIKEESQKNEVEIIAWCLMTNHVHFIAIPHTEQSFPGALAKPTNDIHV